MRISADDGSKWWGLKCYDEHGNFRSNVHTIDTVELEYMEYDGVELVTKKARYIGVDLNEMRVDIYDAHPAPKT